MICTLCMGRGYFHQSPVPFPSNSITHLSGPCPECMVPGAIYDLLKKEVDEARAWFDDDAKGSLSDLIGILRNAYEVAEYRNPQVTKLMVDLDNMTIDRDHQKARAERYHDEREGSRDDVERLKAELAAMGKLLAQREAYIVDLDAKLKDKP